MSPRVLCTQVPEAIRVGTGGVRRDPRPTSKSTRSGPTYVQSDSLRALPGRPGSSCKRRKVHKLTVGQQFRIVCPGDDITDSRGGRTHPLIAHPLR